jgi:hypothetical protein
MYSTHPIHPQSKKQKRLVEETQPSTRASKTTQKICLNILYTQEGEFSKTTEEIA